MSILNSVFKMVVEVVTFFFTEPMFAIFAGVAYFAITQWKGKNKAQKKLAKAEKSIANMKKEIEKDIANSELVNSLKITISKY